MTYDANCAISMILGELETLKNVKKVVDEMKKDSECGMGFLKFKDFQKGDIVQCYTETTKRRTFD